MLIFTDEVIQRIHADIADHAPERGGALLGFPDANIICGLIYDPWGATSGSSYVPSRRLTEELQQRERATGLMFKGIVHSHPGGFDQLSGPDRFAIGEAFLTNAHLPYFVAPIVTRDRGANPALKREIALGDRERMTVYFCERPAYAASAPPAQLFGPEPDGGPIGGGIGMKFDQAPPPRKACRLNLFRRSAPSHRPPAETKSAAHYTGGIEPVRATAKDSSVMPILRHIDTLDRTLSLHGWNRSGAAPPLSFTVLDGRAFLQTTRRYQSSQGLCEALFLFPPSYPFSGPALLKTWLSDAPSATQELKVTWPFNASEHPAVLADACAGLLLGRTVEMQRQ